MKSTYPQNIRIGPTVFSNECSSLITMRYRSDPTLPPVPHNSRYDEITIFQLNSDGLTWIVFRSFLRMNDCFTFKSQRSENDRFHLTIQINGSLDTTISSCCEHPFRHGGRIDDENSSFWIQSVKQYTSCAKCRQEVSIQTKIVQPTITEKEKSEEKTDDALFQNVNNSMQEALLKGKLNRKNFPRHIGNVENFTILYIDPNGEEDLSLLRPAINFIRILSDPNTLGTVIGECTDEKVNVIMSLDQAEKLLRELQAQKCIQSIYFLSEEKKLPEWISDSNKVIGIYPDLQSIRDHLQKTLPDPVSQSMSMEMASPTNTSDKSFSYYQLLKETMLCQDEESDLKRDMLAFCRIHYHQNEEELHQIDQFEKSFQDDQSIEWYTRNCFLNKILSRAFRTQEIDLLFKMRYFIQCLHKQIQTISSKESLTVYTVLRIKKETVDNLKGNLHGLLLFHSFLPTTLERPTSVDSANNLLFSIRVGSGCAAKIEQFHSPACKIDVLINIDTVFRIVSIDESDNGIKTVELASIEHDDSHFQALTDSLRKETKAPVVILQLTKLLLKTDHYDQADSITELIGEDQSFKEDGTLLSSLAASHHLLGNIHVPKKDYQGARYHFFKALRAFQSFLPFNHPMLSSTYNNIGSMFYQDDHHQSAIQFHQMALQCQLKSSKPDFDSIATYSANIGAVYIDRNDHTEAVKHLQRAALILEKMLMKDYAKNLISIYQRISSCFWQTKQYQQALEFYQKALHTQLKLPNPLPHSISITYYNISTAFERIGDFDQAVAAAEKSVEYLKMVPDNQSELKDNLAQLETVKQKQWLQQVLSK